MPYVKKMHADDTENLNVQLQVNKDEQEDLKRQLQAKRDEETNLKATLCQHRLQYEKFLTVIFLFTVLSLICLSHRQSNCSLFD